MYLLIAFYVSVSVASAPYLTQRGGSRKNPQRDQAGGVLRPAVMTRRAAARNCAFDT